MSNFSPFKNQSKYSKEQCAKLFDGSRESGVLAAKTMRENPELYRAIKQSAIEHGMLAAPPSNPWLGHQRGKQADSIMSDAEIQSRHRFSQTEVRELLHRSPNDSGPVLSKLAEINGPEWYAQFKLAARSYGELAESSQVEVRDNRPRYEPQPAAEDDGRFQLSDDFCKRLNLPPGYKTNSEQFTLIMRLLTEQKNTSSNNGGAAPAATDAPATTPASDSGEKHE